MIKNFFKKIIKKENPLIIEKMEVDFFISRSLDKKKLRIVDIGAHHGEFLDIFKEYKYNQKYQIYSIEPYKKNFSIIEKKIKELPNNIVAKAFNIAISSDTYDKTFFVGNQDTLISCEKKWLKKFPENFSKKKKINFPTYSFVDFSGKFKFDLDKPIDFLKIDTEGHDFIVLKSVLQSKVVINSIMIEFDVKNKMTVNEIIKFLKIYKFKQIFIFCRTGIYTHYIGPIFNIDDFTQLKKNFKFSSGNIVAFRQGNIT